jgi:steroid delta-isomerase-like uncharacterized protein
MTRDEILEFFDRRQMLLDRRDAPALAGLHAADGVFESIMGPPLKGRSAIELFYRNLFTSFPDFRFQSEEIIVEGTRVAQVATYEGTHDGTFMGMPPSGKHVRVPGVFLYRLRDHRIDHLRSVYDFTGLLMKIGVLKVKLG